uniref:Uncharacterized protein n=1 Tax=Fagus sylvatica TaxID=28930 RepID=A0A2N9F9X7_FAGSY
MHTTSVESAVTSRCLCTCCNSVKRSIASATPACSKRPQKLASKNSSATQCAQSAEAEQGNSKSIGTGYISPLLNFEIRDAGKKRNPDPVCGDFFVPQHPFPVRGRRGDFAGNIRKVAAIIIPRIKKGEDKAFSIILRHGRKPGRDQCSYH